MQFSIEKLFEMIEQRFGRKIATILLAIVAIAIAAVSIHFIIEFIVSPVKNYIEVLVQLRRIPPFVASYAVVVLNVATLGAGIWIAIDIPNRIWARRLASLYQKHSEMLEEYSTKYDEMLGEYSTKSEDNLSRLEGHLDTIQTGLLGRFESIEERLARLEVARKGGNDDRGA